MLTILFITSVLLNAFLIFRIVDLQSSRDLQSELKSYLSRKVEELKVAIQNK